MLDTILTALQRGLTEWVSSPSAITLQLGIAQFISRFGLLLLSGIALTMMIMRRRRLSR